MGKYQHLGQTRTRPLIKALKQFLLNQELPKDPTCQNLIKHFGPNCFVEDDLVWMRIKQYQAPSRVVLFLPQVLVPSAISKPTDSTYLATMEPSKQKKDYYSATTGQEWTKILTGTSKPVTVAN